MNGLLALLLLGASGLVFLRFWNAEPSEFRTFVLAGVPLAALFGFLFLARPRIASRPSPGLLILLLGAGTVAWVWMDAQTLFPTRTEQWRDITVWAVVLTTVAGIARAPHSSKPPPPTEPMKEQKQESPKL